MHLLISISNVVVTNADVHVLKNIRREPLPLIDKALIKRCNCDIIKLRLVPKRLIEALTLNQAWIKTSLRFPKNPLYYERQ